MISPGATECTVLNHQKPICALLKIPIRYGTRAEWFTARVQVFMKARIQHAHNRSKGAQIIDDIMHSWVLVSSQDRKVRLEAEQILLETSSNLSVRHLY